MKRQILNYFYFNQWHRYWLSWNDFWSIFRALERKSHLEELIRWSKRKYLLGPYRLYQKHLTDIEMKLASKNIHHPDLTKWAYFLYELKTAIASPPKRYARGSATIYRLR